MTHIQKYWWIYLIIIIVSFMIGSYIQRRSLIGNHSPTIRLFYRDIDNKYYDVKTDELAD